MGEFKGVATNGVFGRPGVEFAGRAVMYFGVDRGGLVKERVG